MNSRMTTLALALIAAATWLLPGAASAQGGGGGLAPTNCPDAADPAAFYRCAVEAVKTFSPPRTADGHPDLSGPWRRRSSAAHEDIEAHPRNPDDAGGASVIVDPADGKVPMQPWADAKRIAHSRTVAYPTSSEPQYLHQNAVCYQSGVPGSMYMVGFFEFMQNRDYFVVLSPEAHTYRVIPTAPRPHIGKDITLFQGDSVGRWEGNTLGVETTNLNGLPWLDQRGRFLTEEARVIERFALVDPNTLMYTATVEDSNVYTRPFTMAHSFRRSAGAPALIVEEPCHEGNDESMRQFRTVGLAVYPGISAAQARELRKTWEAREGRR